MKTNIEKTFQVDEPIDKVWDFLSKPDKIVVCVPGASITEKIDDRNYKGKVSLKFGPVAAKYNGEVAIEEMDETNKKMRLKGKGIDARGKGSADMLMNGALTEKDGGTEVNYSMEISITGVLAQFGARLIADVTDQVVEQFIQNFKNELAKRPIPTTAARTEMTEDQPITEKTIQSAHQLDTEPSADNSLNAFSLMMAVIKGFFTRLFGGSK